jgi:hypothetical protein
MSPEVIQRCLGERPFMPMTMFLADHNEVFIDDPSKAELTADGTTLQVSYRDSRLLIALVHIVSIKVASGQFDAFGFGS